MWVQLLIPRIEDGNNFGVSIQVITCWKGRLGRYSYLPCFVCFSFVFGLLWSDVEVILTHRVFCLFVCFQEETVAELRTVESEAASYLDQISR